jgi:beta-N-acetylhexosaminidase
LELVSRNLLSLSVVQFKSKGWLGTHTRISIGVVVFAVLSSVASLGWEPINYQKMITSVTHSEEEVVAPKRKTLRNAPTHVLPESAWVDSIMGALTLDQKIGQLFMVATYSNKDEGHYKQVDRLIQDYHIGGLIFFQGGPYRQARLTNRYQSLSKIPLLIGIDAEWGLGMRLDSTISYPRQMALGAIQNDELIYEMGIDIANQCRRLGIHINFAPVVDMNSNPNNPVIGTRSFGEELENVLSKSKAYMKGLQDGGVIATAKHFPGHGDTDSDSHYTLPVLTHTEEEIYKTDLMIYQSMIRDSLMGVLSGHLFVPALDSTHQTPSSLSDKIINGILRKELGFRGLVFTDAMNMRGVLRNAKAADVNLKALLAGNDILLFPENVGETVANIKLAINSGRFSQKMLDEKVRRILQAKYWAGLNQLTPINLTNLGTDLKTDYSKDLIKRLNAASVTILRSENNLLPLVASEDQKIASVSISKVKDNVFQKTLSGMKSIPAFNFQGGILSGAQINEMMLLLNPFDVVVVGLHGITSSPQRSYGVPAQTSDFITQLKAKGKKVILVVFGNPYSLRFVPATDVLINIPQDGDVQQEIATQVLFGHYTSNGTLPVSVAGYKVGSGLKMSSVQRLGFGTPAEVGMNAQALTKIDDIVKESIEHHVFPGCEVLVARKGKVVYQKQFGNLTYKSSPVVTSETLYDLASITKVAATVQAIMLLYDRKLIDLNKKASHYLPELIGTSKSNMTIMDLLLHQSGYVSFYPTLWDRTRTKTGELLPEYYAEQRDSIYSMQIAPKLYAKPSLKDSVWKWVVESPLNNKRKKSGGFGMVYSDLGFLTLQKVVERISGEPLDVYVKKNIYKPLGLKYLGFNPLQAFPESQIAPTEMDIRFRGRQLQGTVHDQMAAVMGGVSGHAGLFGNANDLAVLLQMNLWKGTYEGHKYFEPTTMPTFIRLYSDQYRRALGWDKVPLDGASTYVSADASNNSFGHTGFTGTMLWADPDEDLLYIFLSNRIHPDAENRSIITQKTRRRIHDVIYSAITERKHIVH